MPLLKYDATYSRVKEMPILEIRQGRNSLGIMVSDVKGWTIRGKALRREDSGAFFHDLSLPTSG